MKIVNVCMAFLMLVGVASAMPLNSSARSVIRGDLLHLISVDYRAIKDAPTAMAASATGRMEIGRRSTTTASSTSPVIRKARTTGTLAPDSRV